MLHVIMIFVLISILFFFEQGSFSRIFKEGLARIIIISQEVVNNSSAGGKGSGTGTV